MALDSLKNGLKERVRACEDWWFDTTRHVQTSGLVKRPANPEISLRALCVSGSVGVIGPPGRCVRLSRPTLGARLGAVMTRPDPLLRAPIHGFRAL